MLSVKPYFVGCEIIGLEAYPLATKTGIFLFILLIAFIVYSKVRL